MSRSVAFDPLNNIDQMASLISQVSGEPIARVLERLEHERQHPGCTVAEDFRQHGGPRYEWGKHLEEFYGSTNAFLYELAVWNRNRLKKRMRRWVARHMSRQDKPIDLLSIGDGLGFDCLHFAARQHRVTYFELPGLSERFARKLFEGYPGARINVLTDPNAIPHESFDAITCFDVLEHVPDPPAMVKNLVSYLRPGGLMYVSAPFYMILPWYPTHLRSNRRFAGSLKLYRDAGLELAGGHITWYPLVLQKPPVAASAPSALRMLPVEIGGAIQKLGRHFAWHFAPIHLARRMGNRRFEAPVSNGLPDGSQPV